MKGPVSKFGILGLQGKNWDLGIMPHLNLGLQKSDLNWDYVSLPLANLGLQPHLTLGLRNYTPFRNK